MGNTEEEIEIDLAELFAYMFHWLWLILLSCIVCGAIGLVFSAFIKTPLYESTTKVYILNKDNNNGTISYSDTQLATQLTKDYEELITCRYVLETVISDCGLTDDYDSLAKRVRVENATDTRIISITVKDKEPADAQRIANAVRDVAGEHIKTVMDIEAVNLVDDANLPDIDDPSEPSIMKYTAVGGLVGVFACVVILIIRYLSDDTIRVSEDVEKYLELSTLGLIPIIDGKDAPVKKKKKKSSKYEKYEKRMSTSADDRDMKIYEPDERSAGKNKRVKTYAPKDENVNGSYDVEQSHEVAKSKKKVKENKAAQFVGKNDEEMKIYSVDDLSNTGVIEIPDEFK